MAEYPLYTVEAVILKRKNIGEADRIVTVFSKEYGKVYALAKGVRKIKSRRGPHLEVFTHARITLHRGKKWDTITEVSPIESFPTLRTHLSAVARAYYLMEIIEKLLPEKQEHADIFALLVQALGDINQQYVRAQDVCDEFSFVMLEKLGFLPESHQLDKEQIHRFIESIVEKTLKSPKSFSTFGEDEDS